MFIGFKKYVSVLFYLTFALAWSLFLNIFELSLTVNIYSLVKQNRNINVECKYYSGH